MTKTCSACRIEKPRAEFYQHRGEKDGLQFHCKKCCSTARKEYDARTKVSHYAMTLDQIAEVLGFSRQYVHRLEQSALAKLRKRKMADLLIMREEAERIALQRHNLNMLEPA